jgi:hypothetical protein
MWQFAQGLGQLLAYCDHHSVICQETLADMPQQADFGGFLYDPTWPSQRDMPTVANIAQIANTRQWIRGRVIAKSAGSGKRFFTSMDALLYGP